MRTRSSELFCPAQLRIEDPPSSDAPFNAFLSSLWVKEEAACSILYSAAIRHFCIGWMCMPSRSVRSAIKSSDGSRSTVVGATDTRLSKPPIRLIRLRGSGALSGSSKIRVYRSRRWDRRSPRHLTDYPMQSTACNSPLEWHRATGRKPSILWLGFASTAVVGRCR